MAKLTFDGGAGFVTGANFLLEAGGKKILVDCGLTQGSQEAHKMNKREFGYDPSSIDYLLVTHAHIDHIGLIPRLVKKGFKGEIWSTVETREITELMLADAVKINREDPDPLYGTEDVAQALKLWNSIAYHAPRDFGAFTLELFDAGHVLGSAMLKLTFPSTGSGQATSGKSILFSGDLGNSPSPLLRDRETVTGANFVVMESVYGDRRHEGREGREEEFKRVIREAHARSGALLIPAFSLERTQEILHMLDNYFEAKELPSMPVFVDSPLAIRVTNVYEKVSKLYNEKAREELSAGDRLFDFPRLRETAQTRDSREINNVPGPKIIIAGSGMSTGGRILGHEASYLPDSNTTILFMGYQAPGTLGRQIAEGMKKVMIDEREVTVRAKVEVITGFSGHADSDALVDFISDTSSTVEQVFVAMGEPRSAIFLAQRLHDELGVNATVPTQGQSFEIEL